MKKNAEEGLSNGKYEYMGSGPDSYPLNGQWRQLSVTY